MEMAQERFPKRALITWAINYRTAVTHASHLFQAYSLTKIWQAHHEA